jgi:hypothetical protein
MRNRTKPRRRPVSTAFATVLIAAAIGPLASRPAAEEPEYPHGSFRDDCTLCHGPDAWTPAEAGDRFDHAALGFPLEGAHRDAPCLLCHLTLEFSETTGSTCADCHRDPHLGELGADCSRCHDTRTFRDPVRERREHRMTRFPLTGVHATLDCDDCHSAGGSGFDRFVNTPVDCWSCHEGDFRSTTSPDHVAAGFPTDCTGCHTEFGWGGEGFDHSVTGFPLTGAHRALECSRCHPGNVFEGASADCWSCHDDDWRETTDPPHEAAGFPIDCSVCHGTASWEGAYFDHDATAFPLTGAHVPLACADCHGDGVYAGRDPSCVACHRDDYDGTSDPSHLAAGFGTDCAACHTTIGWDGAEFDHDLFFPIDSGAHRGEWNACSDCHVNPTSYSVFSCLGCHPHSDRAKTDSDHSDEGGYSYESSACYSCHPDGRS